MARIPFNTNYFPEDIVRDGVNKCCHDFAVALHRRTGWPIAALWLDPLIDEYTIFTDPQLLHAFCVTPDGQLLDVEGLHTSESIKNLYAGDNRDPKRMRIEIHGPEAEWVRALEEIEDLRHMLPADQRIEAAAKAINQSKPFMLLLEKLASNSRHSCAISTENVPGMKPA